MFWRVWLADGRVLTSLETTWEKVPSDGVVVLKVWPDHGPKAMYHGHDAIWWDGAGQVYQLDIPQPFRAAAKQEQAAGRLKCGRLVDATVYARLYEEALAAKVR